MEPIPESGEALRLLSETFDGDLADQLRQTAAAVRDEIPDCLAISVTLMGSGLTFTFVSTSHDMLAVDAAQYLDGGPCQSAADDDEEISLPDVLDEDRWRLFAQASAANGVRSSLSIPLRGRDGAVYGSLNLYGAAPDAFAGRARDLAAMFGSVAAEAVANADLAMTSADRARRAPAAIRRGDTVNNAVGILAARDRVPTAQARQRLLDAAARAGADPRPRRAGRRRARRRPPRGSHVMTAGRPRRPRAVTASDT